MLKWRVQLDYHKNGETYKSPEYHVFAECGDDAVEKAKELDGYDKNYICSMFQVIS